MNLKTEAVKCTDEELEEILEVIAQRLPWGTFCAGLENLSNTQLSEIILRTSASQYRTARWGYSPGVGEVVFEAES